MLPCSLNSVKLAFSKQYVCMHGCNVYHVISYVKYLIITLLIERSMARQQFSRH